MGGQSSKKGLEAVTTRTIDRVGTIPVSGRYHRFPRTIEDDYQLEKKVLGSGYNGQVHLAQSKETGKKFAVKGFKLHGVKAEKKDELESECEIFLSMDHPHIVRLVDVYESEEQLNLVMECMEGGELFKRVTEKRRFSEKDAADATWQMLLAVHYMHEHHVVHRDLKLENFLYDKKDSDFLKLIDFGFSKIWEPNTRMALSCGTLAYVAPEVLGKSYTSQCDMWSLGVVVFIVLFGYMPFLGSEERQVQAIRAGRPLIKTNIMDKVSQAGQDFVKKLLVVDPQVRMSSKDAMEHNWLAQRAQMDHGEANSTVNNEIVGALCNFGQASVFRRACMSMMAWSLTNDERAQVQNAFLEMDTDKTGTISIREFKKVMEETFHVQDEVAVEAFAALHEDHHDEIHYSEFLAAMVSSRIKLHDALLKQTFRRFDVDKTGFITVENLRQVLGDHYGGEDMDHLLAEADKSHDGMISYDEFMHYLLDGSVADHHLNAAVCVVDKLVSTEQKPTEKPIRMRTGKLHQGEGPERTPAAADEGKTQQKCCTLQ